MLNEDQIATLKDATNRELRRLLVDGNAEQAAAAKQLLDAKILEDLVITLGEFEKRTAAFESLTAGLRNVIAKVERSPVGDSLVKLRGQLSTADTILNELKTQVGQDAGAVLGAGSMATPGTSGSAAPVRSLSDTAGASGRSTVPAGAAAGAASAELGALSRRFESGPKGVAAIGHDSGGGWSYGAYQIATKTGTMKSFIEFLVAGFPAIAKALDDAGGLEGATSGSEAFKSGWRTLAQSDTLAAAERAFIKSTHYEPFIVNLKALGLDVDQRSAAIRDVAWSICVQHGPNNQVCKNALTGRDIRNMTDTDIIDAVYDERSKMDSYFPRLNQQEREAVRNRFIDERKRALAML